MNMTIDPNLNAEIFRNAGVPVNNILNVNKLYDFLEINDDNTTLLCANDLVGRLQNSILSLYASPEDMLELKPFTTLREDITTSAAAFVSKSLIFVAEDSGTVKLCTTQSYDGKNNKLTTVSKSAAHHDIILSVKKLPNCTNCITAGNLEIKVWDTNYLEDQFVSFHSFYPAHRDIITDLAVNSDNPEVFVSCSADRTSLLWDLRKQTPAIGLFKNEHGLKCLAWQPNSTIVAFGDCDGAVMLVDIRCPGAAFKKVQCFASELHKIAFCPLSPKLLAMCADTPSVKVIDINKENPNCIVYEDDDLHTNITRGLAWDRCSQTIYTCGYDNKIISHDIK